MTWLDWVLAANPMLVLAGQWIFFGQMISAGRDRSSEGRMALGLAVMWLAFASEAVQAFAFRLADDALSFWLAVGVLIICAVLLVHLHGIRERIHRQERGEW